MQYFNYVVSYYDPFKIEILEIIFDLIITTATVVFTKLSKREAKC